MAQFKNKNAFHNISIQNRYRSTNFSEKIPFRCHSRINPLYQTQKTRIRKSKKESRFTLHAKYIKFPYKPNIYRSVRKSYYFRENSNHTSTFIKSKTNPLPKHKLNESPIRPLQENMEIPRWWPINPRVLVDPT